MAQLICCLLFLISAVAFANETKLSVIKTWSLASDYVVDKKKVGGLSGCSVFEDKIYFVSDDRGSQGGPRVFIFPFDSVKQEINFKIADIISVKTDSKNRILDLEGISVLKKNQIMLSSEGDYSQKPRVAPDLFWADDKGQKIKPIQIPDDYLPEPAGLQKKGLQSNLAFEGLSIDQDLKKWAAMTESSLVQEPGHLKLVESALDSDQFDHVYNYPVPSVFSNGTQPSPGLVAYFGVSEILFLNADSFLILERGAKLVKSGVGFQTQLCTATKIEKSNDLQRQCFYSTTEDPSLKSIVPNGANFEGLCWVNKQKKQFIAVSDNNFSKGEKTVFILYQLN